MDYDRTWRPRNFRDVGIQLKTIYPESKLVKEMLYRGGEFDVCFLEGQLECIGHPKTILNLRAQPDKENSFGNAKINYVYLPTKNGPREYDTSDRKIKTWVREVITLVCSLKKEEYPLYIHCRSGKDRTGIIVGVLLLILGVPLEIVVQEYLLSKEGKVSEQSIRQGLTPFNDNNKIQREFKKCNLSNFRSIMLE